MHKYLYLTISLVAVLTYSQTTINGIIKNQDNEPLAYCSVGIKDSDLGTISDENGIYKIIIPDSIHTQIVFSATGYFDQIQNKNDLAANGNVTLEYNSIVLETAVLSNNKMKDKIIGQKSKPMLTFSKMFDENLPTVEQGNIFNIYRKTKLKDYNFHIIPSSKYEEITLKINIYDVKDNLPGKLILDENIIYKTTTTGWQKIDLSQYGLVFNDLNQIAVTLQLVDYKSLENHDFVFGVSAKNSLSKNLLFRRQSQSEWEKNGGIFIASLEIAYLKQKGEKDVVQDEPE
ncbi:carboxypeptidase-like regulatory domain-containing protein [Moheibacter sediminis]|uniref:CarboxypepD_reg-like domain-containing protein n=1 Tax=Moheibacter sediminis TaxID=1434700 RepID=A0A1W2C120_9FLAO|nr:carboxypeptidase-like regulatory domain-containing protein [Moheibacter sediminis]SMC78879.1 CarboxypepD_reg-like domain-containing protein [Moheibacter sediminis]